MSRNTASVIVALGLVLGSAPMAAARDLCVTIPGLSPVIVGKNFYIPMPNRCKPFTGFIAGGQWFGSGAGCTSADGDFFRLSFTAHKSPTAPAPSATLITVFCSIPRPALTGGSCLYTLSVPSNTDNEWYEGTDSDASAQPCTVEVP